jgi:hypothetical protein
MSFIDSIKSVGKQAFGFLKGNSIGSSLARTALLGYALNRLNKSANKANKDTTPQGTEVTIDPDTQYSLPVLYGSGYISGKIVDARLADNNTAMFICLALCEKTGRLISTAPSVISFEEIYFDNFRISFKSDGITSDLIYDDNGNSSSVWQNKIKVYPFNGSSTSPTSFTSESTGNTSNAYDIMPGWSSTDQMNDTIFCILRIQYDAKNKLTTIGRDIKFKLSNTMTKPGDVMYDYLTNTRYGAGIPVSEINVQ